MIIDELPIQTYYWKVYPFNESETCAGFSPTQTFKVSGGTGINEISDINDYMLIPNPSIDNAPVVLTLTSQKNFEATLTLTDASGRILSHNNLTISSGISEHAIETYDLPVGLYFITLNSRNGKLVEKLLVF